MIDSMHPCRPQAGALTGLHASLAQMPSVQQTAAFREADRDNAALYMIAPWGMGGRLVEVSNGLCAEWFRGVEGVCVFASHL